MSSPADKKPERKPVVRAHNLSLGRYSVTDVPTEESPYEKPSRPSSWPPPPASGVHERVARASDRPPAPRTPSTPPAAMRVREDHSERRIAEVEPIVAYELFAADLAAGDLRAVHLGGAWFVDQHRTNLKLDVTRARVGAAADTWSATLQAQLSF